ncbi:unnamed protein product [Dicrocoelium dendriticum]|nr:unnamed protein product [Dicrocoelium dendriticum]
MSEDFSILTNCRKRQYGSLNESSISDRLCHSHNIGSGDTLTSIAVQYGTTVQHLKLLNHLWTSDITNLKTIRVPASVNTNYDNFDNNEVIEMRSIKANRPVSGETASSEADYWDPSYYYKNLFARIERVKDAASSFLQNRRTPPRNLNLVSFGTSGYKPNEGLSEELHLLARYGWSICTEAVLEVPPLKRCPTDTQQNPGQNQTDHGAPPH